MDRIAATDSADAHKQVRAEDQMMINEFSRNNSRLQDLNGDITERKQQLETLSDAQDEIALADAEDGGIKLLLGESYIDVDEETADDYLTKRIESLESMLSEAGEEVEVLEKRQIVLKAELYGRFGTAINLEK
jgi:prefoldin subunit 4